MTNRRPTRSRSKSVGPDPERSRVLRSCLATFLKFLRQDIPVEMAGSEGLSDWIFQLHGFSKHEGHYSAPANDQRLNADLGELMARLCGPYVDPEESKRVIAQSEKIKDNAVRSVTGSKDEKAVDAQLRERAPELIEAWGVPRELASMFEFSVQSLRRMLRATKANAIAIQLHNSHALTLIARAASGNRQAVLDLIKVDNMFLHDWCTETVIRRAQMQNDHHFSAQLTRAQEYRPNTKVRDLHQLHFQWLFLIEGYGTRLPTLEELWNVLDPHGRTYESLQAFERDFQRRRKGFREMLEEMNSEVRLYLTANK